MAEQLIISISGMRGLVGVNLTADIAADYGRAFGTFLKTTNQGRLSVCIGRDSRQSGDMFAAAVADGLCSVGIDVVRLGIVTTPGVGIMIRHLGCAGGVVITASHNPIEYNGIKLLLGNGIAPSAELAGRIRDIYFDKKFTLAKSADYGKITCCDSTDQVHLEKVLALVDGDKIATRGFKVVLDSVNGAGGRAGVKLLNALGCDVVAVNNEPTGIFAHTPEPTKENLTSLCEDVKTADADVGFAQDPDADRLAIVDNNGIYIGEEYTLALSARYALSKRGGKAVANLSTSRMIDDIAAISGSEVIRTAVGEANVAAAMVENNCVIGGEGNGGVIDIQAGPVRDSLVAMAYVLALMAETEKTIAQLASQIGSYCMKKVKFSADSRQAEIITERVKGLFPEAKVDTTDGCRFDFADGWCHLRCSNTEPVARLIVETESSDACEKYIETILSICNEVTG
jgi:phosphomannomutase